jgi:hypothetical protein
LLSIKLPARDEERVDELSAKARAGLLSETESQELDGYLHVGTLVAVLQSKAPNLKAPSYHLAVNRQLAEIVRERANHCCEYCLLPEFSFPLRFQIDHVLAGKHEGETVEGNLALACSIPALMSGPNTSRLRSPNTRDDGDRARACCPRNEQGRSVGSANRTHSRKRITTRQTQTGR